MASVRCCGCVIARTTLKSDCIGYMDACGGVSHDVILVLRCRSLCARACTSQIYVAGPCAGSWTGSQLRLRVLCSRGEIGAIVTVVLERWHCLFSDLTRPVGISLIHALTAEGAELPRNRSWSGAGGWDSGTLDSRTACRTMYIESLPLGVASHISFPCSQDEFDFG